DDTVIFKRLAIQGNI
ncbi:hypothetical protein D030_2641B, partial [Vibrio parahaemolyticus AQ3810]